jgi:hypothetical protein
MYILCSCMLGIIVIAHVDVVRAEFGCVNKDNEDYLNSS